jgi:hypothetical protein
MSDKQFVKSDSIVAKTAIERPSDGFPLFHRGDRYTVIDVPDARTITVMANGCQLVTIRLDEDFDRQFHAVHRDDPDWTRTPAGWVKEVQ